MAPQVLLNWQILMNEVKEHSSSLRRVKSNENAADFGGFEVCFLRGTQDSIDHNSSDVPFESRFDEGMLPIHPW